MTTRQYRTRTKHQNGASITNSSTSLTVGTLLQGQGLSGATFPYTVAVYAQDSNGNQTSYEVMDVTGGTYPTLTVTRGIDGTTAVAHDTTHIIAQVVGKNDCDNWLQAGDSIDIGSDSANIAKVNLTDQGSTPAAPASGHHIIYSKSGGIYMEDHAGSETLISGGGGMVQLASAVLAVNTASVSFASIPGSYSALLIEYVARSTSAGSALDTLLCRLNGDSAANYDYQNGTESGSTATTAETFGATSIRCGLCVQNGAGSGLAAAGTILIPEYADTSFNKTLNAVVSSKTGTATQNMRNERNAGFWRSSSAITRIDLLPGAGSLLAGCRFRLYGLP